MLQLRVVFGRKRGETSAASGNGETMSRDRKGVRLVGRRGAACAAITALAALVLLSPGFDARAATIMYVDKSNPSCSDTGPGDSTTPFCKIGVAAQKATAGTTVQVAGGTYSEQVSISNSGTSDAPIIFTAAPGASVIINGAGN